MKLNEVFQPKGLLSTHFSDYEQRSSQVEMAKLIESSILNKSSCVIEGATGVGKSFAYLIPLILSKEKAIISTSNKSLQDQLSNKDLPSLKQILPIDFNWTVLKGKNNYFCHEHFRANQKEIKDYFMKKMELSNNDATLKMKEILKWAEKTKDGDVEYYPEDLPEPIKQMITCSSETKHDKESIFYSLCFANKAKQASLSSKIVLVNHTLLALDIALKKETDGKAKILPDCQIIIIDEAHAFEKYAVMAFSDEITWFSLHHLLNWSIIRKSVPDKLIKEALLTFKEVLLKHIPDKGEKYYQQKKFEKFDGFEKVINMISQILEKIKENTELVENEEIITKVKEVVLEGKNLIRRLQVLSEVDENMIRWSEARDGVHGDPVIKLKSVPLDISELLKEDLFGNHTVICTSATLAINNNFSFFKYQIGMPDDSSELIVSSPFNFKENCLVYISTGELETFHEIEQLLSFSKGRSFILFTSYKDMRHFYDIVDTPYPKMIQDNGVSRVKLLEDFKNTPNAVLFATKSFWEGVDIRGDQLLSVIIHKLPFESPHDLIYSSKTEKIDREFGAGKHWSKFTIPDMCLKLKQGVGRLIRSNTDVGIIAVLDSRINYRNYGQTVLNSLPSAYRTQKLEKVKQFYERWKR